MKNKKRLIILKSIFGYIFSLPFVATYITILGIVLGAMYIPFTENVERPFIYELTDNNMTYYVCETDNSDKREIILEEDIVSVNKNAHMLIYKEPNKGYQILYALGIMVLIILTGFSYVEYYKNYSDIKSKYYLKHIIKVKDNDGTYIYVLFGKILAKHQDNNTNVFSFQYLIAEYINGNNLFDDFEGTLSEIRSNKISNLLKE